MSRCFPFPPPGYERKHRIEDLDISKKEKHKKRREREKRDDKEKIKRKNKDVKDKGKDRVRDRASSLGETRLPEKTNCHNGEFIVQKDHKGTENCILTEKKHAEQSADHIAGEFDRRSHFPEATGFEIVPTLGKRIKNGYDGFENPLGEKFSVCLLHQGDEIKSSDQEIQNESKFSRRSATNRGRVKERMDSAEKNADKRMEGNGREGKSKGEQKDNEGKREGKSKEKNRDKKKKREKKIEQKIKSLENSKENNINNITSSDSIITSERHKPVAKMGRLVKRKDIDTNEILQAKDGMSLTKFTSSFDLPRENGKILRPCQSSLPDASNRQATASNHKFDDKEHGLNSIVEILPALSSPKSVQIDQMATVHSKPPHPDFKYLSQVYLVPNMEEWSDFCDHDWLYSNHASKLKSLKVHCLEMEMTPHVWAEAMQIESTDIYALPYVVPY